MTPKTSNPGTVQTEQRHKYSATTLVVVICPVLAEFFQGLAMNVTASTFPVGGRP